MRLSRAFKDHLRHNVVGYIALFCFVAGGTAIALPGKNSVDSGDIKPKSVRAADLGKGSVTSSKLAPNAVDSSKVRDDALTGADIDERTLVHPPLGVGVVGSREEADRERRVLISAGAMVLIDASQTSSGSFAVVEFSPSAEQSAVFTNEIPGSRVEGTNLTLRLIWSSDGSGDVAWAVSRQAVAIGEDVTAGATLANPVTGATANHLSATEITIPGSAVQNDEILGVRITRDADNPADTLGQTARLHLVELNYTATG